MTRNNDWTYDDLRSAEVVPGHSGDGSYLVRLDENEYVSIPNTGLTTLALHDDVFDSFDGGDSVDVGDVTVEVDFNFGSDEVSLTRDGETARIPSEKHENVFYALYERDDVRLQNLHDKFYKPTVRRGLLDQMMPRFRQDDEIRKTDEGWLLEDEVLVRWDASNEIADTSLDTHVVRNGSTRQQDVGREAIDVAMPAGWSSTDSFDVVAPDGRTFDLDPVEIKFLTTVGLWLNRNPSHYDDDLAHTIGNASTEAFTDPKSGIRHGHSRWNKADHHVTDLGVTEEAAEMLWSSPNDHGGPHELMVRRREFENAPIDVFTDAPNDDVGRWEAIESAKNDAPIPQEFKKKLEEMFSSDD